MGEAPNSVRMLHTSTTPSEPNNAEFIPLLWDGCTLSEYGSKCRYSITLPFQQHPWPSLDSLPDSLRADWRVSQWMNPYWMWLPFSEWVNNRWVWFHVYHHQILIPPPNTWLGEEWNERWGRPFLQIIVFIPYHSIYIFSIFSPFH